MIINVMKKTFAIFAILLVASTAMAQGRYQMKSGIAKTVTTVGDSKTEATQYWDDYGGLECLKQRMDIPGLVSYDYYTITKGDKAWFVTDTDGKKASKVFQNPTPDLNFLNITPAVEEKYNIKDFGGDTYLGKPCKKYTYETTQNRKKGLWTVWVYKGFILKSICVLGKRESIIEVVELKENVPVPPEVFDIP
jgi:hypothetical protein